MPQNVYRVGHRWRYRFMCDGHMVNGPGVETEQEARELFKRALLGDFPAVPRGPHRCAVCRQEGHYKRTCGKPPPPLRQPRCCAGNGCDVEEDDPGYCARLGFCGLVKCWENNCGARGKWDYVRDGYYCHFHRNQPSGSAGAGGG